MANTTQVASKVETGCGCELEPLAVPEIGGAGRTLRPTTVFRLPVKQSDDGRLFLLQYDPWGLDAFAGSRAELIEEFKSQMSMLWLEYAREADDALSPAALLVKRRLLADWTEVNDAA